jgi:hypothetical protein
VHLISRVSVSTTVARSLPPGNDKLHCS